MPMNSHDVVKHFKQVVENTRAAGVQHVSLESLSDFTDDIEKLVVENAIDVPVSEKELEILKARLNAAVLRDQYAYEKDLELIRATVGTAQSALKASILINGGAAVALLAFVSGVWPLGALIRAEIAQALLFFTLGVLCSAVASLLAYFTQAGFGNEFGEASQKIGTYARYAAMLVVLGSFGFFIAGSFVAYNVIGGI